MTSAWTRRAVTSVVVALLGAGALGGPLAGGRSDPSAPGGPLWPGPSNQVAEYTGFGGYWTPGPVHSLSATWRVPAIAPDSPPGAAATWIGVLGRHVHEIAPFIQVGTLESADGVGGFGGQGRHYEAFWTTTSRHWQAIDLGNLAAGDRVTASLTDRASGWSLNFADVTAGWSRSVAADYEPGAAFDDGEWIQEDPTYAATLNDVPYPRMAGPTFTQLRWNGAVPRLAASEGIALSTLGGTDLVPGPEGADRFSLVAVTGPARRYLDDALAVDDAYQQLGVAAGALERNRDFAPPAGPLQRYGDACRRFTAQLQAPTWPGAARPSLRAVAGPQSTFCAAIVAWYRADAPTHGARFRGIYADASSLKPWVGRARTALGLPPN